MRDDAYLFSNDPAHSRPWNPDWATHKVAEAAATARVKLDIKGGRHYTASQLPGRRLRPAQHRCPPRPQWRRGDHPAVLRPTRFPRSTDAQAAYLAKLTAGSEIERG